MHLQQSPFCNSYVMTRARGFSSLEYTENKKQCGDVSSNVSDSKVSWKAHNHFNPLVVHSRTTATDDSASPSPNNDFFLEDDDAAPPFDCDDSVQSDASSQEAGVGSESHSIDAPSQM